MNSILIAYYSGTGSTAMAAKCLAQIFERKGILAKRQLIRAGDVPNTKKYDMLLMLYPVYALNAPRGVYQWIRKMPAGDGTLAAVVSVSGGGEIFPNTACRVGAIRRLKKNGYNVFYENMLVMPANFAYGYEHPLPELLVQTLPQKASAMADEICGQAKRRTRPLLIDRLLATLCVPERLFAGLHGRFHSVSTSCNACGWCANNCPAGNIHMKDGKPSFSFKCQICMKCLYFCPKKAISPGFCKWIVLKDGFPIEEWKKSTIDLEKIDLDHLTKGYAMSGARAYLRPAKK